MRTGLMKALLYYNNWIHIMKLYWHTAASHLIRGHYSKLSYQYGIHNTSKTYNMLCQPSFINLIMCLQLIIHRSLIFGMVIFDSLENDNYIVSSWNVEVILLSNCSYDSVLPALLWELSCVCVFHRLVKQEQRAQCWMKPRWSTSRCLHWEMSSQLWQRARWGSQRYLWDVGFSELCSSIYLPFQ